MQAAGGDLALEFLSGAGGTLDLQWLARSERESEVDEERVLAHEVAERPALIRADQHGIARVATVANADTARARHRGAAAGKLQRTGRSPERRCSWVDADGQTSSQ